MSGSTQQDSLWKETKEWHGRVATLSLVFFKASVREIEGVGVVWCVNDADEQLIRRNETDYGTAKNKAFTALQALTAGH